MLALVQDHGDQKSGNHIECLNCNNAREQPDPQDGASRRVRDHDTERQQKSDKATSRPPHSAINAPSSVRDEPKRVLHNCPKRWCGTAIPTWVPPLS